MDSTTPTTPSRNDSASNGNGGWGDRAGLLARGMGMGAADIVPGVSGGTIAFITGIYERFVTALRSLSLIFLVHLARGRPREAWRAILAMHWGVLIPLGLGVMTAVLTMSRIITGLMEDAPGPTYAFFFGLIIASAWIPFARMRRRTWEHAAAALLVAVAAFVFVGLQPDGLSIARAAGEAEADAVVYAGKIRTPEDPDAIVGAALAMRAEAGATSAATLAIFDPRGLISEERAQALVGDAGLTVEMLRSEERVASWLGAHPAPLVLEQARAPLWWIFLCGLIAISAMMLPGVSGSFLLLFLGQYHVVLGAISGVVDAALRVIGREPDPLVVAAGHTPIQDVTLLVVFNLGVLLGLGLFSRVVGWLLERRHDVTMAALTGLMVGALRQPGEVVLAEARVADQAGSYWVAVAVTGAAGAAIVTMLHYVDTRSRARRDSPAPAS
jgi:putative membrane protein